MFTAIVKTTMRSPFTGIPDIWRLGYVQAVHVNRLYISC